MVEALLNAPPPRGQILFVLSVSKINMYFFHGKRSGLLDTAIFKGNVSLTVRVSLRLMWLYFMYAKHFGWKLIHQHIYSTARAHRRLNKVLKPHYDPAVPGSLGARDSNDWCTKVANTVEAKNIVHDRNSKKKKKKKKKKK